jgi:hypothetical protein
MMPHAAAQMRHTDRRSSTTDGSLARVTLSTRLGRCHDAPMVDVPTGPGHPDDEFHPPASDDPWWTETCWFTFTVPDRGLSGQLYPFFRPNLGVVSAAAYFWDATGDRPDTCRYAKHFWHLPMPTTPLTDLALANGLRYRCLEPQRSWQLRYDDPDGGDEIHVDLTFTGVVPPNYLGASHLDQAGRYQGTIVLHGDEIAVDAFGFRDRSWGPRDQFGPDLHHSGAASGGYSYATASADDAFHLISMDFGTGCIGIHGFVVRDGTWAKAVSGTRTVEARDGRGHPTRVTVEVVDELGRTIHAEGRMVNAIALFLNPNLFTINCLTEWTFDGVTAWGEDHDNHSAPAGRRLMRAHAQS